MKEKPLILYDGECILCSRAANFILDKDKREVFLLSPNRSESGWTILEKFGVPFTDVKTILLLDNGKLYAKSTAVLLILRQLPFPWDLLSVFVVIPKGIRDFMYDLVARNRYKWFGKTNRCRMPGKKEKHLSRENLHA